MFSLSQFRRPGLISVIAGGAILLGGCSMPMGNLMGGGDKPDVTSSAPSPQTGRATAATGQNPGAVQLASAGRQTSAANPLNQNDWNYARGALGLALTSTHNGPPVPWANPETGARGNFAPTAEAVTAEGRMCRDFVATRSENGQEVQLRGRACRTADGQWDIAETTRTTL